MLPPYGVGAVLSHLMPDRSEKPIIFGSLMLPEAEKSYSQIEKEGLAIIFVVKRFHQSITLRHFTQFKLTISFCLDY